MTRQVNGVWTIDFGPVQPGIYRYTVAVDGVRTTDPHNRASSESLTSVRSMYEVPSAPFVEYKPGVSHGKVATVWYDSKAGGRATPNRRETSVMLA